MELILMFLRLKRLLILVENPLLLNISSGVEMFPFVGVTQRLRDLL